MSSFKMLLVLCLSAVIFLGCKEEEKTVTPGASKERKVVIEPEKDNESFSPIGTGD